MIVFENDEMLKSVKADMSIIPAYSMSFTENSLYVAEAIEESYNEMFQSIGINELAVFESTGMQIVYEGEQLKTFKEAVIGFFKRIWAAIKGAFESVIAAIKKWVKEAKAKIYKVNKDDLDKVDKKEFGKTHEFDTDNRLSTNAIAYAKDVDTKFSRLKDDATADEIKALGNELDEAVISEICKNVTDAKTIDDMKTKIKEQFIGKEVTADKAWVVNNLEKLQKVVLDDGKISSGVKDLYISNKKLIDSLITKYKGLKDVKPYEQARVMVLKHIAQANNTATGVVFDVYKKQYAEYRNILFKVASACHKVKGDKPAASDNATQKTNEAYTMNMIEEAFAW